MTSSVLVTGTSSGFGRLTAETLARRGHVVFAGMREPDGRNAEASKALTAAGAGKLSVLEMDVASDASVRAAVARALETAGSLDAVVNNAGFGALGLAEGYTDEQARAVFDTNVLGPQRVFRAVLPHMRERGSGLFVTLSTTMTQITIPFAAFYTASKRALEALAETYRYELAPLGIDSVILEAGPYPTPGFTRVMTPSDTARFPGYGWVAEMPLKVFGGFGAMLQGPNAPDPQEVADKIADLVEMPAGTRPLRTVLDRFVGGAAETVLATAATVQEQVMNQFGMGELRILKPR